MLSIYNVKSQLISQPVESNKHLRPRDSEITEYLSKFMYPISTLEPNNLDDNDLNFLNNLVGDAKIIGLPESKYFEKSENYKIEYRISKFLINKMKFNVFAIGATMPNSNSMNQYIIEGKGNPKKFLNNLPFYTTLKCNELLSFIEWLRNYNIYHNKKVSFEGYDMYSPYDAIEEIRKEYQNKSLPEKEVDNLKKELEEKIKFRQESFDTITKNSLLSLLEPIKQKSKLIKNIKSQKRFLQYIRVIEQYIESKFINKDEFTIEYIYRQGEFTAENVIWLMENYKHSKIIISDDSYKICKYNNVVMGSFLNKKFGNNYVNFGFINYGKTETENINNEENSQSSATKTLKDYLISINQGIFVLDLKSLKQDENYLSRFLLKDILYSDNGTIEITSETLTNNYDYLVFINN